MITKLIAPSEHCQRLLKPAERDFRKDDRDSSGAQNESGIRHATEARQMAGTKHEQRAKRDLMQQVNPIATLPKPDQRTGGYPICALGVAEENQSAGQRAEPCVIQYRTGGVIEQGEANDARGQDYQRDSQQPDVDGKSRPANEHGQQHASKQRVSAPGQVRISEHATLPEAQGGRGAHGYDQNHNDCTPGKEHDGDREQQVELLLQREGPSDIEERSAEGLRPTHRNVLRECRVAQERHRVRHERGQYRDTGQKQKRAEYHEVEWQNPARTAHVKDSKAIRRGAIVQQNSANQESGEHEKHINTHPCRRPEQVNTTRREQACAIVPHEHEEHGQPANAIKLKVTGQGSRVYAFPRYLLNILVVMILCYQSHAAVTEVALTESAIQSAIGAAGDGDTLLIAAGTNTFSGTNDFIIDGKQLKIYARRVLYPSEGRTRITNSTTDGGTFTALFSFGGIKPVTVAGFDFANSNGIRGDNWFSISATNLRITDCVFENFSKRCLDIYTPGSVLVDRCTFRNRVLADNALQGVRVYGNATATPPTQPAASQWNSGTTWGTTNRIVLENCTFDFAHSQDAAIEMYYGADATLRFSVLTNEGIHIHGNDSGVRSAKDIEVYGNVFVAEEAAELSTFCQLRGGTAIIASNRYLTYVGGPGSIDLDSYRSTYNTIFPSYANGFLNISNVLDGCTNYTGWPGLDQIGRTGPTTFNLTNVSQPSLPVYTWSNTLEIVGVSTSACIAAVAHDIDDSGWPAEFYSPTNHIKEQRDFFNYVLPSTSVWQPLTYPHPMAIGPSARSIVGTYNATGNWSIKSQ